MTEGGGTATAGGIVGVGGAVVAGLGVSTIHILQVSLVSARSQCIPKGDCLPMCLCRYYLGHSMGKGRLGVHMEDRVRVLTIGQTPIRQDDGQKVKA